MADDELAVIEAALFMSARAMGVDELAGIVKRPTDDTRRLVDALASAYERRASGLRLVETGEGYRLSVRDDLADAVSHLAEKTDITEAELRTLAVIAYCQPILQSQLVRMRGNNAYAHIASLREKGYVEARQSGRSLALSTTDRFRTHFAVSGDELGRLALEQGAPAAGSNGSNEDVGAVPLAGEPAPGAR